MTHLRSSTALAALLATACATTPSASATSEDPRAHAPRPTTAAITAADLRTRLFIFADDSMLGRQAGSEGARRADAYIERELRRLGLRPAGDDGSFFQAVPLVSRAFARTATLEADGVSLAWGTDFLAQLQRGAPRPIDGAQVIYGGTYGGAAALTPEQVRGKVVVLSAPAGATQFAPLPNVAASSPYGGAAAVVAANLDLATPQALSFLGGRSIGFASAQSVTGTAPAILRIYVTRRAAESLLGASLEGLAVGATGKTIRGNLAPVETPMPARNIVAMLPGRDPALAGQYVAVGAHSDHVGGREQAVDHDSLRAFNRRVWELRGMVAGAPALNAQQRASIAVNVDSLRALRPPRRDSIANGADDDGSGSMALLEMAETMAAAPQKPRRSVLFVWHTAEEMGLLGARWFTDHMPVSRDSVVAQLNIDMIGRGGASDTKGGGPNHVGLLGSRRLSSQLGSLVEVVNQEQRTPLALDYSLDADGHPENLYCRSDHYEYAKFGIPIAFFFTGLHEDYHQVTDEPQYIDYPHYARITQFINDLALKVANRDARLVVDKPRMDPSQPCRQ